MYFVRPAALLFWPTNCAEETKTCLKRHCYSNGEKIRRSCRGIGSFGIKSVRSSARFRFSGAVGMTVSIYFGLIRLNLSDDVMGRRKIRRTGEPLLGILHC